MIRSKMLAITALLVASLASCGGDEPGPSAGAADAAADAADRCCPIEEPTCDCFATGGSRAQRFGCRGICDVDPHSWVLEDDENGCPVWRSTITTPNGSCFFIDAGAVDASEVDGPDATDTTDAIVDDATANGR